VSGAIGGHWAGVTTVVGRWSEVTLVRFWRESVGGGPLVVCSGSAIAAPRLVTLPHRDKIGRRATLHADLVLIVMPI
jgi:hypothetical protein